jgi:hypothetical protein
MIMHAPETLFHATTPFLDNFRVADEPGAISRGSADRGAKVATTSLVNLFTEHCSKVVGATNAWPEMNR